MAQQTINNGETGLSVRTKINQNFTELYGKVTHFFGFYPNPASLRVAHPTASDGDRAWVGTTDTWWYWDVGVTDWVDSNVSLVVAGNVGEVQFNDTSSLGADSNFFWDNSNKRLGLGTNSPNAVLEVRNASGEVLRVSNDVSNYASYSVDSINIVNKTSFGISFGGSEKLKIESDGKLTINGTVSVDGVIDDDTFITASDTVVATADSIKNYLSSQLSSTVLDDLADVGILAPSSGDVLVYGGTSWANQTMTWALVDKTTSSLADITTRSAGDLSSGNLAFARMPTGGGTWCVGGDLIIGCGDTTVQDLLSTNVYFRLKNTYLGTPYSVGMAVNGSNVRFGAGDFPNSINILASATQRFVDLADGSIEWNPNNNDMDFTIKSQTGTAFGFDAGTGDGYIYGDFMYLTSADHNTMLGAGSGNRTLTGTDNFIGGNEAGKGLTSGSHNICFGNNAGEQIASASGNICIGHRAGNSQTGSNSIVVGYRTARFSQVDNGIILGNDGAYYTTMNDSVVIGSSACRGASGGTRNNSVAIGYATLYSTDGSDLGDCHDLVVGYRAGNNVTTGKELLFLGSFAGRYETTNSNIFILDNLDRGSQETQESDAMMYGEFNSTRSSQTLKFGANVSIAENFIANYESGDVDFTINKNTSGIAYQYNAGDDEHTFSGGMNILAHGTTLASVSTGTADNDKLVTQGYVDDAVAVENLWDRAGTVLSPHTSDDTLEVIASSGNTARFGTTSTTDVDDRALLLENGDGNQGHPMMELYLNDLTPANYTGDGIIFTFNSDDNNKILEAVAPEIRLIVTNVTNTSESADFSFFTTVNGGRRNPLRMGSNVTVNYGEDDCDFIVKSKTGTAFGVDVGTGDGFIYGNFMYMTSVDHNTILGADAGNRTLTGTDNFISGDGAGSSLTSGDGNIVIGKDARKSATVNNNAICIGAYAGEKSTISDELYIGYEAGRYRQGTASNIGIGRGALKGTSGSSTGTQNTAVGYQALSKNTTGNQNVSFGTYSGFANTTGSGNVMLGYTAGYWETGSNKLFIDNQQRTDEATSRTHSMIYGEFNATRSSQNLYLNANVTIREDLTVDKDLTVTGDVVMMANLPTSDPSNSGQLWNDSGTVKVSA